jgi:uncharacterized protein
MKIFEKTLLSGFALLLFLFYLPIAALAAENDDPLKILMITGGGPWHDYEVQKKQLEDGLKERIANIEITIDHEPLVGDATDIKFERHENTDWAKEFDLVIYNQCHLDINDTEYVDRIINAHVEYQVPAVMLHCAFHAYRDYSENWYNFIGGRSHRHEGHIPFTVETLEPEHPIMVNFPRSWRTPHGELYMPLELSKGAVPLARAYGILTDTFYPVAWTYEYYGVRVFNNTLGHHDETMGHDVNLNLVASGLLWAAGKLQDDGSPAPGYEGERGLGWISLTDGETLNGWRASETTDWFQARRANWPSADNTGTESFWVRDNNIVVSGPHSNLFYEGSIQGGDFINFEFKSDIYSYNNSQSGIFFHTRFQDKGTPKYGHQVQFSARGDDPQGEHEWLTFHVKMKNGELQTLTESGLLSDISALEHTLNRGTVALHSSSPNSRTYFRNILIRLWPD